MAGLKLGREIAVDLKSDADFNQNWRCPCHDGSVLRLALPRTATLPAAHIAKGVRYKRPPYRRSSSGKFATLTAMRRAATLGQRARCGTSPRIILEVGKRPSDGVIHLGLPAGLSLGFTLGSCARPLPG